MELTGLVRRHLDKGAWSTCPTCGGEDADVDGRLTTLPVTTGAAIACVVVTCAHCGHLRLFSASQLGVSAP